MPPTTLTSNTTGIPPQSAGLSADRLEHLVHVLEREIAKARLPGAVALVARRGQVLLHRAVGQQNPVDGTPMALDSIFRI